MSLQVSNTIPIDNYSAVVLSDNAGTTFNPTTNGRIRVKLPSTLGMIDFHSSYLQFDAQVKQDLVNHPTNSNIPMSWSHNQGATSVVRDLRILVDGKEVESIANYNVLDLLSKQFGRDLSLKEIQSVLDKSIGNNQFYTDYVSGAVGGVSSINYNNVKTKQILELNLSGLLSLQVGFPILATGDVELEITLEDNERALQPVGKTQNLPCNDFNITGGIQTFDTVNIKQVQTTTPYYLNYGWGVDVAGANTDCPFSVGSNLKLSFKANGGATQHHTAVVSAVALSGSNEVQLTFVNPIGTGHTDPAITDLVITLVPEGFSYEINNVEFVARAVNMPPPYLNSLQQRINTEGGMSLDIHSFSSYLDNIDANISRQSLNVPCYSSRLKAVFGVPVQASQDNFHYDRQGKIDGLRNYQSQIGDRREPSRPVDLTNTTLSTEQYQSQEYLQELQKSFMASSMGLRTLRPFRENFVLNRSLSFAGGSEDLTDKMFRFEVEHNSGHSNTAKNVFCFAHHIKRLQITPSGLMVYS